MANVDNPNGFQPYSASHSGSGQPVANEYPLASGNTAFGKGCPLAMVAGVIDVASAGSGNALTGIAAESKEASDGGTVQVWDDPSQLFVAQTDDGTGVSTSATVLGLNANFVGVGVSSSKISTSELDEDSATLGATLQFRVLQLSKEMNGNAANAYGEFNRLVVRINNHAAKGGTGTVGT